MITILKTQDFTASDLAEYIMLGMPILISSPIKRLIQARIKLWLLNNSVEVKPKPKPKKTGRRKQLEMKLGA